MCLGQTVYFPFSSLRWPVESKRLFFQVVVTGHAFWQSKESQSWPSKAISFCGKRLSSRNNSSGSSSGHAEKHVAQLVVRLVPRLVPVRSSLMAHNAVSSEAATEVMTDSRESPLLIHNQATRRRRSFRDENVRYRFLKWIALSISALFVVNINLSVSRSMPINKFVLRSRLNIIMCNVKVLLQK